MASAAAVATTVDQSPQPYQDYDEITNTTATVIGANEKLPDEVDGADGDDDEDIARPTRRQAVAATLNGAQDNLEGGLTNGDDEDGDDGLFGSDPEDDKSPNVRRLDDEELDSGDDEGRNDRAIEDDAFDAGDDQQFQQVEEQTMQNAQLPRHPEPEPSDGELYLLKVPRFLSIGSSAFDPMRFEAPKYEHHSTEPPPPTFSARNIALTTVRWRPSPSSPSQLQSNSRIIRWSDGSLTLQMANEPQTQYTIRGRSLAPAQYNPRKPTPTSLKPNKQKKINPYKIEDESFTYLTAPNQSCGLLRITQKFTASLTVDPPAGANNAQIERLRAQYAALQGNSVGETESTGMGVVDITEDPELSKKKAELAEKEKQRAQKRREMQEQRERERGLGPRSGFARRGERGGAGLTIGGLEDDDELGRGAGGRGPASGRARPKPKKQNRIRGEILSDDEEEYGRRIRTKEDEYDEEDDFVARSDEDEEVEESDGDEDEGIILEPKSVVAPRKQQNEGTTTARESGAATASSKRDLDMDAEGDVDEDAVGAAASGERGGAGGSPTGRTTKRRRVIEDEDEE